MMQQMKMFPPATMPVQEDGWLSPDGVFYPCGCYNHSAAAEEIAGVGTCALEESGWLHISESRLVNAWTVRRPTQAQANTLFDLQMVNPESRLGFNIGLYLGSQEY